MGGGRDQHELGWNGLNRAIPPRSEPDGRTHLMLGIVPNQAESNQIQPNPTNTTSSK